MKRSLFAGLLALAIAAISSVGLSAELLTIEQALARSQATGRPILAMAGSKTCAPCQALLSRLSTDVSIAPLVTQFVPLKIDSEGEHWGEWSKKYRPEGNGIPILFVIRADGQMLYGKSGAKEGPQLPLFLAEHLKSAGRILSDEQLATIRDAVEDSNKALAEGDAWTAVKRIEGLKKIGTPGKLGSYASVAQEADALHAKLVEEGKAALAAAKEKLAGEDKFAGVLKVISANRVFGSMAELRKDLATAERDLGKDQQLKEIVKQAEALDRALAMAAGKTTQRSAPAAFEAVITRYPGTSAAELAKAKLAELGVETTAVATSTPNVTSPALRTWTDSTGKFQIEAELVKVEDGKVQLKQKDGQLLAIALEKLSKEDQEYLAQQK